MKRLIVMAIAILLTGCITAFASDNKQNAMPKKQFNYQMSFTKIIVADDIDLQLKESINKIIDVAGNETDIEKVDWKIKGDILYIQSKTGSLKDKVKVTINVTQLKEITIKGQSVVSSDGPLLSPVLYVYIEDDCQVAIKNFGQIYITKSSGTEVDIEKLVGDVRISK